MGSKGIEVGSPGRRRGPPHPARFPTDFTPTQQRPHADGMVQPEELVGDEWAEWYRLTPVQRWLESEKLWQAYLAMGGSLDPEPDTQSPFFDAQAPRPSPPHGQPGVRVLRRGGI